MYPLIYKNKWNLKVCYIFISIQVFLPLILYSYTFDSIVELIIDYKFDRSYFDIESHFSRIATNITLGIIVILSAIISLVLNLLIWIKYKKFFEVKVKDQDVIQKFSYFIYTIILSISLFIFAIQQCIRFESIFYNDQVQRNNLSLWIYWVLPFITTFQPYYLVLCSKSIRSDILHTLGISYVIENNCPRSIFTRNGTTNRTIPNKIWISK
uniref:Serpentine receptor class gamma n=1 Tax=Strongyloides venezuelensis TaxID=75913 RepID=A0A0K0FTP4_STRVS